MGVTRPPLEYLASCSKIALESFELSRLNEASNYRKEVQQILQGWIDTEVDARLARWILESKQAQARDGLQAAMAQPVPLKQLDLSFLPSNGAQESAGEVGAGGAAETAETQGNARKSSGSKLRPAAERVLPCAAERTPGEPQKPFAMKAAKLLEKRVGGAGVSGGVAAFSAQKPAFAQDEENALHKLEYFVQREFAAPLARARNFAAASDSNAPDGKPRLAGDAGREVGDHFAEVHVFPSTVAMPAAAAHRAERSRARLKVRTLICRPGLERSRSKAIRSRAVCARRVAPSF